MCVFVCMRALCMCADECVRVCVCMDISQSIYYIVYMNKSIMAVRLRVSICVRVVCLYV